MKKTVCRQCGECCRTMYLSISKEDFKRWKREGRTDILSVTDSLGDGFWRPGGDEPAPTPGTACPWLMYQPRYGKHVCRIHETKPDVCRDYKCGCQAPAVAE